MAAGCLGRGLLWRLSAYQLLAIPEAQGDTNWLKPYTSMDILLEPMAVNSAWRPALAEVLTDCHRSLKHAINLPAAILE